MQLSNSASSNRLLQEIHIAIIGANGSGKSALTVKYLARRFIGEYDPNIEDTYCKQENISENQFVVWVMDTVESGKNKDPKRYLGWADIIIVVYSIISASSFDYAENLLKMIAKHDHSLCARPHTVCLYGNKIDLDRYRQTSKTQGHVLAQRYDADFYEGATSEQFIPIRNMFHDLIKKAAKNRSISISSTTSVDSGTKSSSPDNNTNCQYANIVSRSDSRSTLISNGGQLLPGGGGGRRSPLSSRGQQQMISAGAGQQGYNLETNAPRESGGSLRSRSKSPAAKLHGVVKDKFSFSGVPSTAGQSGTSISSNSNTVGGSGYHQPQQQIQHPPPPQKRSSALKLLKLFQ